jgi:pimeloyl-ACP methyl ester carboxylesterase
MRTAACNGVVLHYERVGGGPRFLYCNGSGTTLDSNRLLLEKLSAQFELLAFDYRGMGRSAPITEPYAMADVAADVAALLDAVGSDRTALAGLSYGGMVAQEFAVTFPDRLDRLALMATSPGGAFASYPLETLADTGNPGARTCRTSGSVRQIYLSISGSGMASRGHGGRLPDGQGSALPAAAHPVAAQSRAGLGGASNRATEQRLQ